MRLQQALGHAGAQAAHGHALLGAVAQVFLGGRGRHLGQCLGGHARGDGARGRHSSLGGTTSHSAEHVALGHAAILAAAGHSRCGQVVLGQQLGGSGHRHIALGAANSRWCGGRSRCRGGSGCCSSGGRSGRAGLAFGIDLGNELLGHHGGAVALDDFSQHTSRGGRHFKHHLVGFDLDQDLIHCHSLTGLFLPRQHGGLGHGFGQLGDFDFYDSHINSFGMGFCSVVGSQLALLGQDKTLELGKRAVHQRLLLFLVQVRVAHGR